MVKCHRPAGGEARTTQRFLSLAQCQACTVLRPLDHQHLLIHFCSAFYALGSWLLCSFKPQKTTNIKVIVVKSMATTSSSTFIREILSRRDEWKVQIASCKWHSCGLSLVLGPSFLLSLLTSPMAMAFDLEISKVAWSISSSADPTNCWVSVKWHVSCWV